MLISSDLDNLGRYLRSKTVCFCVFFCNAVSLLTSSLPFLVPGSFALIRPLPSPVIALPLGDRLTTCAFRAQPQISTRGIDSVRSPVTNLTSHQHTTHEQFVRSVAWSFLYVFRTGDLSGSFPTKGEEVTDEVEEVEQGAVLGAGDERSEKIRAGMEETKVRFFPPI